MSPISLENSTVEQDSTLGFVDDRIARNAAEKALNPRRKNITNTLQGIAFE